MSETAGSWRRPRRGMWNAVRPLAVCVLLFLPQVLSAGERFDGKWLTTVTCPAKGNTEGYKLQLPSVIKDGNFRGERGTAGEPGYLLIEGKIEIGRASCRERAQ